MNFIVTANTDIGIAKSTNQDSLMAMSMNTPQGRMAFAVLCDGMGGLQKGEVASTSVINAFRSWAENELPKLCKQPLEDTVIRNQWCGIIDQQNKSINVYGAQHGVRLGTTSPKNISGYTSSNTPTHCRRTLRRESVSACSGVI